MSQATAKQASTLASLIRFGRDVREESRRVSWPTLKETRTMAIMVFILVALVATFLVLTDLAIGFGLSQLLGLKF